MPPVGREPFLPRLPDPEPCPVLHEFFPQPFSLAPHSQLTQGPSTVSPPPLHGGSRQMSASL